MNREELAKFIKSLGKESQDIKRKLIASYLDKNVEKVLSDLESYKEF
jgi:hypothetical protein